MAVYAGQATDIGKRPNNEDSIYYDTVNGFFVVADGAGGLDSGEVASNIVVTTIRDYLASAKASFRDKINALLKAIEDANLRIYQIASAKKNTRMATTVTALLIGPGKYFVAHVGDSRAYLIRSGQIKQITQDHSFVQQLVNSGIITPWEARTHERRNEITRVVGHGPAVEIAMFDGDFTENDVMLLCSDGLWGSVTDDEILSTVLSSNSPQIACNNLIGSAISNYGSDNISAILIQGSPTISQQISKIKPRVSKATSRKFLSKATAIGLGLFLAIMIAIFIFRHPRTKFIYINTSPESIDITSGNINHQQIHTGDSIIKTVGETLGFTAFGYQDMQIVVEKNIANELNIRLDPVLVTVNFKVGKNTDILIDNRKIIENYDQLKFGKEYDLRFVDPSKGEIDTAIYINDISTISFAPIFKEQPPTPSKVKVKVKEVDLIISGCKKNKTIDNLISGADIFINGQLKGIVKPIIKGTRIEGIPVGKTIIIELKKNGHLIAQQKKVEGGFDGFNPEPKYFADDFKKEK
jgi:protein phosphatase